MKYSDNYEFSLPYKADNDPADIDILSENFKLIDAILKRHEAFLGNNAKVLDKNEVTMETSPSDIPLGVSVCFVDTGKFVDGIYEMGVLKSYNSGDENQLYQITQVWYGFDRPMQRKSYKQLESTSTTHIWEDWFEYAVVSDIEQEVNSALSQAKESGEFDGDDGLSAYEIWLSQGNTGSEADFLASLKGDAYTLTEADKQEIVDDVVAEVPFAKILEDNAVTLETLPSEIPAGVTYCFVRQNNIVDHVWQVGLLVSYNSNQETDAYRVCQVWYGQLEDSAMQRKSQKSSGSLVWGEFEKYVTNSDLTKEVEDALTEAKESGEFDGDDGYTPRKGVDYWTEEDKAEIIAELSQIEAPKIVSSVEEMTDTTKHYVLKDTNTIWAYMKQTVIVEHEAENKFVPSDAQINKRMGSSSLSTQNGYVWSGAIPVDLTKESPFRVLVEGTKITEDKTGSSGGYQKLWLCSDAAGNTKLSAAVIQLGETSDNYTTLLEDGTICADYKGGAKLSDSIILQTKSIRVGFWFSSSAIGSTSELSGVKITFPCEAYSEEITVSDWTNTGLKPDSTGGGNYVSLLVKVNENAASIKEIDERVIALETGSDSITLPSFWESAVEACVSKIKALQIGRNCITFPFFSDNHQRNGYAGVLISKVMKECNIPFCFYGGDSIDSDIITDEATMIAQDKAFDTIMSYVPNSRFCRAVGNHDGYWYDGTNKYYYSREQIYELFLREESVAQNKHFGENGTYYYIDDMASKVRFIVLNTNVHRDTSGNIVGDNVEAEQLTWLENTALSFNESGWAIVFISHQPISNHYHANISNAEAVITIVKNYINGNSTNKADVIGWFSGHIHRDRIYTGIATNTTDDTQGDSMGFTQVTITSDHTSIAYDDATKHTVANDDLSHAIDFVTINKNTRTVNLTRLGIGEDRSYTY